MKNFKANKKDMVKIFEDNNLSTEILNTFVEDREKNKNEDKKWFSSFVDFNFYSIKIRQYSENDNIVLEIFE